MSSAQSGGRVLSVIAPAVIGLLLAGAAAFGIVSAATGAQGEPANPDEQVVQYGEN